MWGKTSHSSRLRHLPASFTQRHTSSAIFDKSVFECCL
jgi:hypothetical protein